MKKTYMAPKAQIVQLALEGMVATSRMEIDESYAGEEQLSSGKESIWDNSSWDNE